MLTQLFIFTIMLLSLSPYVIIVIVFFSTMAFLVFFALSIEFIRIKVLPKKINNLKSDKNRSYREAKIYTLLYENADGLSEEELLNNFDNIEEIKMDLDNLLNSKSIEKKIIGEKTIYFLKKEN